MYLSLDVIDRSMLAKLDLLQMKPLLPDAL